MTCKDCIGYKFCSRGRNGLTNFYGKENACNNVEYLCQDFTNKADFAEVVRCVKCKDFEPHGNGKAGICRSKKIKPCLRYATDFCSYGERKAE